ncbi:GNAT family N-acetyltransferase [Sulfitobacter guttiformis]|uniref:L-ornithine N(alpha)-acyltransferase n=1 Tax=Sulfitobacter guttiformis TaxID=74349 RepID=A0A420DMR3_9RHOB|nr:GNAT family N-acetyltransferase [Sulfitobacter guttiformis]KIN72842.1 Ornithine-acyl[acyl carrier protein] N-acyltransferase [Sulfitobacter guttiformis KCTC 32187]RKE95533.1 ornithine-acyl[acyl carrier protein] N-acyltransferase [Sulfitobacter guttiformis]
MTPLTKGKYTVGLVQSAADMEAAFELRGLCFGMAGGTADAFDAQASHVMVRSHDTDALVATFRMAVFAGADLQKSYAATYYDLTALREFQGTMLELGRFCIHPDHVDPDILRIAWAALTAFVDTNGVQMLFGCSSFSGTDPAPYLDAFALLKARHLGPARWIPQVASDDVYRFGMRLRRTPDLARATAALPPLLRTYLMMGGWVSDHAVIDRAMNTLHVFTALEIGAIPPARKSRLRALV